MMDTEVLIAIEQQRKSGKTITTESLAKPLGFSQQTASRKIRKLELDGLVDRKMSGRGQEIRLTEKGRKKLRSLLYRLTEALSEKRNTVLRGMVISGSGEGEYYMKMKGYINPINKLLGFSPFPGTLNVVVDEKDVPAVTRVKKESTLKADGFKSKKRSFGGVYLRSCMVNDTLRGAIIFPVRTHHTRNIIEIISSEFIRGELSLEDHDTITIEVAGND